MRERRCRKVAMERWQEWGKKGKKGVILSRFVVFFFGVSPYMLLCGVALKGTEKKHEEKKAGEKKRRRRQKGQKNKQVLYCWYVYHFNIIIIYYIVYQQSRTRCFPLPHSSFSLLLPSYIHIFFPFVGVDLNFIIKKETRNVIFFRYEKKAFLWRLWWMKRSIKKRKIYLCL